MNEIFKISSKKPLIPYRDSDSKHKRISFNTRAMPCKFWLTCFPEKENNLLHSPQPPLRAHTQTRHTAHGTIYHSFFNHKQTAVSIHKYMQTEIRQKSSNNLCINVEYASVASPGHTNKRTQQPYSVNRPLSHAHKRSGHRKIHPYYGHFIANPRTLAIL